MIDRTMSDFWTKTAEEFTREGWMHMAEAAREIAQTWLAREDRR